MTKLRELKIENKEDLREREVISENPLKEMFVEYVGEKFQPADGRVTVQMVATALADEFPEFLLLIAEQNYMQGYRQAFEDIEKGNEINKRTETQMVDVFENPTD
jgi:hypothetical protein